MNGQEGTGEVGMSKKKIQFKLASISRVSFVPAIVLLILAYILHLGNHLTGLVGLSLAGMWVVLSIVGVFLASSSDESQKESTETIDVQIDLE